MDSRRVRRTSRSRVLRAGLAAATGLALTAGLLALLQPAPAVTEPSATAATPAAIPARSSTADRGEGGAPSDERSAAEPPTGSRIAIADPVQRARPKAALSGTIHRLEGLGPDGEFRASALVTEDGESVLLSGPLPEGLRSGSRFTGTVAIPPPVAARLSTTTRAALEALGDGALSATDPRQQEVLRVAALQEAAVPIAEATVVQAAAIAPVTSNRAHTLYIAVVRPKDCPDTADACAGLDDAKVDSLVAAMHGYWREQSGGRVSSLTKHATVLRYTSAHNCSSVGGVVSMWSEAVARFRSSLPSGQQNGFNSNSFFDGTGKHLVLLNPSYRACKSPGFSGLGHLGASDAHQGGMVQSSSNEWRTSPSNWSRWTLAHELGHNFGLGHANVLDCNAPRLDAGVPSSTMRKHCYDLEYRDYQDVMGAGAGPPPAISAPGAIRLGFLPADTGTRGHHRVLVEDATVQLAPVTAATGLRALRVTEPVSGQVYSIEYRDGGGRDAESWYATMADPIGLWGEGYSSRFGRGVRVLTFDERRSSSILLNTWAPSSTSKQRQAFLAAGQQFTNYNGRLAVTVHAIDGGGATVEVDFLIPLKSTAAPKIGGLAAGAAKVGSTLTASTGSWEGVDLEFAYQWYRGAQAIAGADRAEYTVAVPDHGQRLRVRVTASDENAKQLHRDSAAVQVSPATTTISAGASNNGHHTLGGPALVIDAVVRGSGASVPIDGTVTGRLGALTLTAVPVAGLHRITIEPAVLSALGPGRHSIALRYRSGSAAVLGAERALEIDIVPGGVGAALNPGAWRLDPGQALPWSAELVLPGLGEAAGALELLDGGTVLARVQLGAGSTTALGDDRFGYAHPGGTVLGSGLHYLRLRYTGPAGAVTTEPVRITVR